MRLLRWLGGAYVIAELLFTPGIGLVQTNSAAAQVPNLSNAPAPQWPLPNYTGPYEASQGQFYMNNLVASLNQLFQGYSGLQNGSGSTQMLGVSASSGSNPIVLAPANAPGQFANANVGIALQPTGNGNITLFYSSSGGYPTTGGVLAFGNTTSVIKANGIDRCPGNTGGAQFINNPPGTVGMTTGGTVVTKYLVVQDWLGRSFKVPGCG